MADKKSSELVKKHRVFNSDELQEMSSFTDALNALQQKVGEENVQAASEVLGDGFKLVDNKDQLAGVPFLVLQWDFTEGDHGEYVYAHLMTKNGDKLVLIDGGTGIFKQLADYSAKTNKYAGLYVEKGLRRSDYEKEIDGKMTKVTTYYLDVSA